MKYKRIRGPVQEDRCTDGGGRLYCPCGCQSPQHNDPQPDLTNVVVTSRAANGYADYNLSRNGQPCGQINTQYAALVLDGYEYLGCNREELKYLRDQIFDETGENRFPRPSSIECGDTLAETAVNVKNAEKIALAEQDNAYKGHPGYCTKCHGFCYGDCEAN